LQEKKNWKKEEGNLDYEGIVPKNGGKIVLAMNRGMMGGEGEGVRQSREVEIV
jgi:hypothetical protein